jgi:hypothetical protein
MPAVAPALETELVAIGQPHAGFATRERDRGRWMTGVLLTEVRD